MEGRRVIITTFLLKYYTFLLFHLLYNYYIITYKIDHHKIKKIHIINKYFKIKYVTNNICKNYCWAYGN
jgi:cell division septal protein FtsQ